MRSSALAVAGLAIVLSSSVAVGQTLLRDFNTTPSTQAVDSTPGPFVTLPNGHLMFSASTPETGRELFTSDGTAAGTTLLIDIWPGANGSRIGPMVELSPGVWLFAATTFQAGWELWRTDGTAAGTFLVKDILPGKEGSVAVNLLRVGNRVVFFAQDGVHGIEPWVSDGTPAGTQMIADVVPGAFGMSNGTAQLAAIGGNRFVFSALINSAWELWVSDVTAAGTFSIQPLSTSSISRPNYLTTLGNVALFVSPGVVSGEALWITDGTAAGTVWTGVTCESAIHVAGNLAYFTGLDPATGYELWKTDGTVGGTGLVVDLFPGPGLQNSGSPSFLGALQGDLVFFGSSPAGRELYRSNGTAAGTTVISSNVPTGSFFASNWGQPVNGFLYYAVTSGAGPIGLHRTDGTAAGTTFVTSVEEGYYVGSVGSTVVFNGDDQSGIGSELWTTNGTPAGTQLLVELAPQRVSESSYPRVLGTFRDRAIVAAVDAQHGGELWLSDGTPAGTQLLVDLEPGPGSGTVRSVAANERAMLILANPPSGDGDPRFSDGTAAGTYQLDILPANSGFSGIYAAPFGERFVFQGYLPATGSEPWITDGTVAGTHAILDLSPGSGSSMPAGWFPFGDKMLFVAQRPADGWSLWSTDGTAAGTVRLGPISTFDPAVVGGLLYYTATSGVGEELWCTDGTPAGTHLCVDLESGPISSEPRDLLAFGNRLLLTASLGAQRRVILSDGTATGTVILHTPTGGIRGPELLDANHAAFVVTHTSGARDQLWRTDGTVAGTTLFRFVETVQLQPTIAKLGVDRLVIPFDDGFTGLELWSVDGTIPGTTLVGEIGHGSVAPYDIVRAGHHIVFAGDDGVHGVELFELPFANTLDWAVETYGFGCAGTGGVVPRIGLEGAARGSAPQPLRVTIDDALPNTLTLFGWSLERGETVLPGCSIWLAGNVAVLAAVTDVTGHAAVPIQLSPALVGLKVDAQFLAIDPAGPALGAASTTPAIEFVVGQ